MNVEHLPGCSGADERVMYARKPRNLGGSMVPAGAVCMSCGADAIDVELLRDLSGLPPAPKPKIVPLGRPVHPRARRGPMAEPRKYSLPWLLSQKDG